MATATRTPPPALATPPSAGEPARAGSAYSHRVELAEGTWAEVYYLSGGDLQALADYRTAEDKRAALAALFERLARRVIACHGPASELPFLDQPATWQAELVVRWDEDEEQMAVPPAPGPSSASPSAPAPTA